MPDNPQRWPQVKELLAEVLATEPALRPARIAELCGSDAGLRAEVEAFLACEDDGADDPTLLSATGAPGLMVGRWRILREIGRGGMGSVWLAERADDLYEKTVAIKFLESALPPAELLRRFEAERRILARLDHPSVARLLDAGIQPGGRPWFALEFVDGLPLTTFAHQGNLSVWARIDLFLRVCEGVGAAHRQLIAHLDLKPANILVTDDGSPRLLDFGLARITESDDDPAAQAAIRMLTPGYASPEQTAGRPAGVASDIYSLGVILRELLKDTGPLPEDVECITAKATATDSADRYRSVDEFADDLRRFAGGLAVLARNGGWAYRASRFVRRHRLAVATGVIALTGIVAASGMAIYQGRAAQRRFAQVRKLANSLVFELHDSVRDLPGSLAARELIVRRAIEYLDSLAADSAGDYELKKELAESWLRIGDVQGLYFESNLGRRKDALVSYERALALLEEVASARRLSPSAPADLAEAHIRVASSLESMDRPDEAERHRQLAEQAVRKALIHIPPHDIALAKAGFGRAESLEGHRKWPEALAARRETLRILEELDRKRPGDPRIRRFVALAHKRYSATLVGGHGDLTLARQQLEAALRLDEAALDPKSAVSQADYALDWYYFGTLEIAAGNPTAARANLEKARGLYIALAEADHQDVRSRFFLGHVEEKLASLKQE